MEKDVFYLPDFFTDGSPTEDIIVHFYTADHTSIKNRIVYNQNMIGFLQHGIKEVYTSNNHAVIDHTKILLLNSGSVLMSQSLTDKNDFESILLFFSNTFISEFILKYAVEIATSDAKANKVFTISKDSFLQNFEHSLTLLKQVKCADLQKIKVEELLLYLLQQFPEQTIFFLKESLIKTIDTKVRQIVHDNLDKGLSIEELAFLCNMSVSTFKRHFLVTFGTNPKKYLIDIRMAKAKQLLQMHKRASAIYAELGYESLSSFSNEFKKRFGVSPKQFQNEFELKEKLFELTA